MISVSAGADVYAPTLDYLIAMFGGALAVYAGGFIEKKMRVDDAVGAVAVHGVCGFWSPLAVGLFAAGYPTGINNIDSSLAGQLYAMAVFFPLGFLGGYIPSWILKKANLMRVPPEVELEGLDMAEFQTDFYPEFGRPTEVHRRPRRVRRSRRSRSCSRRTSRSTSNGNEAGTRRGGNGDVGAWDSSLISIVVMLVVVGTLGGWAIRADRRRRAEKR